MVLGMIYPQVVYIEPQISQEKVARFSIDYTKFHTLSDVLELMSLTANYLNVPLSCSKEVAEWVLEKQKDGTLKMID
jgi:hypothetical protein